MREVVEAVRARSARTKRSHPLEHRDQKPAGMGRTAAPAGGRIRPLVIAELRSLGIDKNATVQSFDVRALQAMHRQAPELTLAFLIENIRGFDANLEKLGFHPAIYSPYYQFVSKTGAEMPRERHETNPLDGE